MNDIIVKYVQIHEDSIVRPRNAADVKRLKAYLEDQVPKELAELKVVSLYVSLYVLNAHCA